MRALSLLVLLFATSASPHDGPDPIGSWRLAEGFVADGRLQSLLGVDGRVEGAVDFVDDGAGTSLARPDPLGSASRDVVDALERLARRNSHLTDRVETLLNMIETKGFGDEEVRLQDGTVPAGATVRYDLELTRVSVPPS